MRLIHVRNCCSHDCGGGALEAAAASATSTDGLWFGRQSNTYLILHAVTLTVIENSMSLAVDDGYCPKSKSWSK
jgi:hypothetical protein